MSVLMMLLLAACNGTSDTPRDSGTDGDDGSTGGQDTAQDSGVTEPGPVPGSWADITPELLPDDDWQDVLRLDDERLVVGSSGTILRYADDAWTVEREADGQSLQHIARSPDGVTYITGTELLIDEGHGWVAHPLSEPGLGDLGFLGGAMYTVRAGELARASDHGWLVADHGRDTDVLDISSTDLAIWIIDDGGSVGRYDGFEWRWWDLGDVRLDDVDAASEDAVWVTGDGAWSFDGSAFQSQGGELSGMAFGAVEAISADAAWLWHEGTDAYNPSVLLQVQDGEVAWSSGWLDLGGMDADADGVSVANSAVWEWTGETLVSYAVSTSLPAEEVCQVGDGTLTVRLGSDTNEPGSVDRLGPVIQYDGTSWHQEILRPHGRLLACDDDEAWLLDIEGHLYHGDFWAGRLDPHLPSAPHAMVGAGDGVLLVGDDAMVLHARGTEQQLLQLRPTPEAGRGNAPDLAPDGTLWLTEGSWIGMHDGTTTWEGPLHTDITTLAVSPTGEPWVVVYEDREGSMWRRAGGDWERVAGLGDMGPDEVANIDDMVVLGETDVWVQADGNLWHWTDEGWARVWTSETEEIHRLDELDGTLWAAGGARDGSGGFLMRQDGEGWTAWAVDGLLRDAFVADDGHLWAVGDAGTIVEWDGSELLVRSSPAGDTGAADTGGGIGSDLVSVTGEGEWLWVVTDTGALYLASEDRTEWTRIAELGAPAQGAGSYLLTEDGDLRVATTTGAELVERWPVETHLYSVAGTLDEWVAGGTGAVVLEGSGTAVSARELPLPEGDPAYVIVTDVELAVGDVYALADQVVYRKSDSWRELFSAQGLVHIWTDGDLVVGLVDGTGEGPMQALAWRNDVLVNEDLDTPEGRLWDLGGSAPYAVGPGVVLQRSIPEDTE